MELLLIIGGIWCALWIAGRVRDSISGPSPTPRSDTAQHPPASARRARPPTKKDVYRPRPSKPGRPRIVFDKPKPGAAGPVPTGEALAGLHDAFTGAPLDVRNGLHQCPACQVYYHTASVAVLREENASRCVACGSGNIVALTSTQARSSRGRDYNPDVVTLANYRDHFDRVITFEGKVQAVRLSRRGMDYAVMFENAAWTKGLKLVFFRGSVRAVGGSDFIDGLGDRTVRVRGLLINHPRFGPEIIISERGMILKVSP